MERKARKIWKEYVPFQMCPCCGKDTVLLKLPGFGKAEDPRWYIRCFLKGWDRNPWYVNDGRFGRNAIPHPRRRFARNMQQLHPAKTEDPFFSLPSSEGT